MSSGIKIGDSRVIESRESADGVTIRRRRETTDGKRFTTYERIERPNLAVIKKDGRRELFVLEKLQAAVTQSVGKYFDDEDELQAVINNTVERMYELGENDITSRQIGEIVLDELVKRNEVAYVRFASVFYEFKTLNDFVKILEQRQHAAEGGR